MCDVVSCKECGAVAAGGEQAKFFSGRQLKKRAAAGAAIGTAATCRKCLEEKEQAKKERGTQHRLAQQLRQEERREAAGAEAAARAQWTAGTASRPRAFMAAAAGPYLQELVADGGGWRDGDNVVRGAGAQIVSVPRTGQTRLWLECAWPVHSRVQTAQLRAGRRGLVIALEMQNGAGEVRWVLAFIVSAWLRPQPLPGCYILARQLVMS